ncbi:DUF3667 domain-containing protein [Mitsuaria sp. WAJ17]|uniref:DUF3667 domain-containing protein n=1 Tax=Mitsuaria sp. WAJ17 TaxID=2761452 RepID=UPI0016029E8A|nr:DUF3667 domain-containing protein [Mitsuaria sp. WAJ17]MBB2484492.1 DUF3667 domain-containing protein [Mitsuaria sp. WAJ17]
MEFLQQFGGAYISTEGALWRTLKLLLTRPGALTADYLRGKRRSHVLPLRLYLTISVLTLALLRLLGHAPFSEESAERTRQALQTGSYSVVRIPPLVLGMEQRHFTCTALPDWYCVRARTRLEQDPGAVVQALQAAPEQVIASMGRAMFVLLPVFALLLKLLQWRRDGSGLRYTEHLVFALHLHCVWFLSLWLVALPALLPLGGLWNLGYTLLALRRVYGRGWLGTAWRATLLLLAQAVLLFGMFILSILWTVVS